MRDIFYYIDNTEAFRLVCGGGGARSDWINSEGIGILQRT